MSSALAGVVAASRRRSAGGGGTPTVLGYNVKGASQVSSLSTGRLYVSKFTLASPGTLTELHGWFLGNGTTQVRIVVYDDDAGGALPGTRMAYTSAYTPPASDTEVAETGLSVALAAGDWWVGFVSSATGGFCYGVDPGGTHQGIGSGAAFTPPPNPFGTPSTSGTRKHSCWAIVNV